MSTIEITCPTCGRSWEVVSAPTRCKCGTIINAEGKAIVLPPIYKRPGDIVKKAAAPIANLVGLQDCGGCDRRRKKLNRIVS